MSLDPELIIAIEKSVKEENQPKAMSKRLISWMQELSEQELNAKEDREHLELVLRSIDINQ